VSKKNRRNLPTTFIIPVISPSSLLPKSLTFRGGWCYDEDDCYQRSLTKLGSSSTWPALAKNLTCTPTANTGYFNLWYGDGASFTGYRADPWPVPGTSEKLYFRGIRNLDASLDHLFKMYNLADVELLIVTGGSAGGLSTFLHVDHIADRMAAAGSKAIVRGNPVCGYFLDAPNDGSQPMNVTYPLRMQYVYNMQNSTGSLSTECQSVYGIDAWKCIMAPHAAKFVKTPWFAFRKYSLPFLLFSSSLSLFSFDNYLTFPSALLSPIYRVTNGYLAAWQHRNDSLY
jgi:O-palmitoleoyl-L-serine hydrolase